MVPDKKFICGHSEYSGISLCSDTTMFYIDIVTQMGDNFLSVGHSSPNYADIYDEYISSANRLKMINQFQVALDALDCIDIEEMPAVLYKKLKEINGIFNFYKQ